MGGNRLEASVLWEEYHYGKQTYVQLSKKYSCSARTIQRYLDKVKIVSLPVSLKSVNLLIDTTYFGRTFGVMVFKDSLSGIVLHKQYVKHETNLLYLQEVEYIINKGIVVQSIICDGRKGLFALFGDIPVQMCQFHQIQIVSRYITRNPKHPSGSELRNISLLITKKTKHEFVHDLDLWYEKWSEYYNERSVSAETGKSFYTHKRLRSAYLSLRRNMPYLFTFEIYKSLDIPNTTNALDGMFAELKKRLRNHNGLNIKRKQKFIDGFFRHDGSLKSEKLTE